MICVSNTLFIKTNNEVSNSVMKAALIRSHSFSGVLCCENTANFRKYALHFEINSLTNRGIRRAVSVSDINVIHSGIEFSGGSNRLSRFGSRSFPAKIPEEEYQPEVDVSDEDYPFSSITLGLTGALPESGIPVEEIDFPDGGCGKGSKSGGGGDFGFNLFNGSSFDDRSKIGAYYQEMLKSNPNDSLLLRNYGKFLHEVLFHCDYQIKFSKTLFRIMTITNNTDRNKRWRKILCELRSVTVEQFWQVLEMETCFRCTES